MNKAKANLPLAGQREQHSPELSVVLPTTVIMLAHHKGSRTTHEGGEKLKERQSDHRQRQFKMICRLVYFHKVRAGVQNKRDH